MNKIKSYNIFINEELYPETYYNASSKLKDKGYDDRANKLKRGGDLALIKEYERGGEEPYELNLFINNKRVATDFFYLSFIADIDDDYIRLYVSILPTNESVLDILDEHLNLLEKQGYDSSFYSYPLEVCRFDISIEYEDDELFIDKIELLDLGIQLIEWDDSVKINDMLMKRYPDISGYLSGVIYDL